MIGQAQRRSPTSSTEVVGSIRANPCAEADADKMSCSDVVALCTLDGTYGSSLPQPSSSVLSLPHYPWSLLVLLLGVVRLLKDRKKQWELQVDHGLFAIGKLDVTVSQLLTTHAMIVVYLNVLPPHASKQANRVILSVLVSVCIK